jgi:hypothetical protein
MNVEQSTTVDRRGARLIVASYSRTMAGFWVMNGVFTVLDDGATTDELGSAVRAGLEASDVGVSVPDRSFVPIQPLLHELDLKTFGAYLKGAKSVEVRRGEWITISPATNKGARAGFVEIEGAAVRIGRDADTEQLGAAVLEALEVAD